MEGELGNQSDLKQCFLGTKFSKIQWYESPNEIYPSKSTSILATGSWDEELTNDVSVWRLDASKEVEEPELLTSFSVKGSIHDLKWYNSSDGKVFVICSTSFGSIYLLRVVNFEAFLQHEAFEDMEEEPLLELEKYQVWTLHNGPCTFAIQRQEIISVGEDGAIHILDIFEKQPKRAIYNAESVSIRGVAYVNYSTIVTVNSAAHLRLWDLRERNSTPPRTMKDEAPLNTVAVHPSQPEYICSGSSDGCVQIWDTLQAGRTPPFRVQVHGFDVWQVMFHPNSPNRILTCSDDGRALSLDFTGKDLGQSFSSNSKGNIGTTTLVSSDLPITSFDFNPRTKTFVCSSDNGCLFFKHGVFWNH